MSDSVEIVVEVRARTCSIRYKRSIYQKYGIAQSVYVPQGFSPVTFTTGPTAQWGRLRKRGDDSSIPYLHGNLGHMTTSRSRD